MLKIICNAPQTMAQLGLNHYDALNKIVENGPRRGEPYQNSQVYKLKQEIIQSQGEEKRLFEYLLGYNNRRLKAIIAGQPPLLNLIIEDFERKFPQVRFYNLNEQGTPELNVLGQRVSEVFNYKNYRKSPLCIENLRALGIGFDAPCPYCNCDDLRILENNEDFQDDDERTLQALLDLDHFFPKYKYPFFAVSLFNLVPSCHNCNSNEKGKKDFLLGTHVNPFMQSFHDLFSFSLAQPYLDGHTVDDLNFIYKSKVSPSFPNSSLIDLRLMDRYRANKPTILSMLERENKKPYEVFAQFFSAEEIEERKKIDYRWARFPFDESEISKYKLGKLQLDIQAEFLSKLNNA